MHPVQSASTDAFGRAPAWGSRWKSFVHENAARWTAAHVQTSSFPCEENFLDVDIEVRDPLGDPDYSIFFCANATARSSLSFGPQVIRHTKPARYIHAPYGGTRMGDNAGTNLVDRWGFSHEVPNLGVLGASVMGTSGARNPTQTVQALARRTAEHLIRNWKTIAV